MKQLLLVLTIYLLKTGALQAQTTAEDSVKAVVNSLFEGMRNGDGAKVKAAFADSALLQTIGRNKEGNTVIRNSPIQAFADFVSKQQKGAADERIEFARIDIDGPLASVWTPYKFYLNGQLHHCGVNSFQVVRLGNGWKIQYIIDTRRMEGCQ